MKKCVVLKKYRDMQMNNKLFKKGDIVSYEEDRANKLAVLGYLKIVEDVASDDLINQINVNVEDLDPNEDDENTDSNKGDEDTETDEDNEKADSDKDDEDLDAIEDDENTDSNKDDEDVNSKDIEMASMPKKSKKKM